MGQILSTLVGYIARPSGIQVLFYGLTVGAVVLLMTVMRRNDSGKALVTLIAAITLGAATLLMAPAAHALSVKSPYVHLGEAEVEHSGIYTQDNLDSKDAEQEYEFAVSYGLTSFWKAEFETELEGDEDHVELKKYKFENTIQLAEQDEYFVDPGFYVEYTIGENGEADAVQFGPIFAKSIGKFDNKLNLFAKKELGSAAAEGTAFRYQWQTLYRWESWLKPGFEVYGDTAARNDFDNQKLRIGPVLKGSLPGFTDTQKFAYEIGYLFGATKASPDGTLRWKLEYEFYF